VLQPGQLAGAFQVYFAEMARCEFARCYWALLHVMVCLPDICAALEADDGETNGGRYVDWCNRRLTPDALLTGADRWEMRCRLLHQGRGRVRRGQYKRFSFGQPNANNDTDHRRVDVGTRTLFLDVGLFAGELRAGVQGWAAALEGAPRSRRARNVARNMGDLVRVEQVVIPALQPPGGPAPARALPSPIVILKTN
jgi:hypothetical protein